MKARAIAISAGFLLLVGCGGHKEAKTTEDLKAAFEKPAGGPALNSAPPEVKAWVDQAVTAMKNDDQATAVMSLRSLRSSGQLTADQTLTVEDMMNKARGALVQRAARGDQQAQMALQMLNQNPPR
jgi:hypothetical protein